MNYTRITNTIKVFLVIVTLAAAQLSAQVVINGHNLRFDGPNSATLVGEDGTILVTTNRGADWSFQNSGITNVLFGYSHLNKTSLIAGENGVILRTIDNGRNWAVISTCTNSNLNDIQLMSNGRAVACGNNGRILISENQGETWYQSRVTENHNFNDLEFISNETGFIAGDYGTLLKTTDGGFNWEVIDVNSVTNNFNAIELIDEKNIAVVGDNGNICTSTTGGLTWTISTIQNGEADLFDVIFLDAGTGIITGEDNLIFKTTDGGISWLPAVVSSSNNNDDYFSVDFADPEFGIAISSSSGIGVFTTDGGSTWSELGFVIANSKPKIKSKTEDPVVLNQNFPNPFNPTTKISYNISFDANVSIKIYDITGREVAALVSGKQEAGIHTVEFDASSLSSGVYFYRLTAENGIERIHKVMKMILTK